MDARRAVSAQISKRTGGGFTAHAIVPGVGSGGALTARSCYRQYWWFLFCFYKRRLENFCLSFVAFKRHDPNRFTK
jgi:hypothetical protein